MPNMHERSAASVQGLVVPHVLDGLSFDLRQEMGGERGLSSGSEASRERRGTASEAMALPWMQFTKGRPPEGVWLLVWQGTRPTLIGRSTATQLRQHLREGAGEEVPPSMQSDLSCWTLSALRPNGPYSSVLLWQA